MKIIAYETEKPNSGVMLVSSNNDHLTSSSFEDLMYLLLDEQQDTMKVCWNLNETIAPLLTLMGEKVCRRLHTNKRCYFAPFNVFHVKDKVFSVQHIPTKAKANLYGIDQFFPEFSTQMSLENVADMARYLLDTLHDMSLFPTKLTSPIAIYEECVLNHTSLPTKDDMPDEAASLAYMCSGKLWIEAHKLGFWEKAYDYDIISSFPKELTRLVDIRNCKWHRDKSFVPDAVYGYADCNIKIHNHVKISPILHTLEDGSLISPVGQWNGQLTKREIEFIWKWGIGEVDIKDAWWCTHPRPDQLVRPLENIVERLLTYKARGGLKAELAKRMSVGIYGKLGEDRGDRLGPHFNPCWFAETSTNQRLEVAEFIYQNKLEDSVIHVSVDGVLSEREAERIPEGWKFTGEQPALVFSSGNLFMGKKSPKGLNIQQVIDMFNEHPRQGYYETKVTRRVTLGDALSRNFEDMGEWQDMISSLDFYRTKHDREFKKLPKSGGQLLANKYESTPIKVHEVNHD